MDTEFRSIAELAYQLWEARGRRAGCAEQDWLDAERQLQGRQQPGAATSVKAVDDSLKGSFPASDPPASRLPDEPPVNAEAKWAAAGVTRGDPKGRVNSSRRTSSRN